VSVRVRVLVCVRVLVHVSGSVSVRVRVCVHVAVSVSVSVSVSVCVCDWSSLEGGCSLSSSLFAYVGQQWPINCPLCLSASLGLPEDNAALLWKQCCWIEERGRGKEGYVRMEEGVKGVEKVEGVEGVEKVEGV
jgi:hypothetical protein